MTLIEVLRDVSRCDLLRMRHSDKNYFSLYINAQNVFNTGNFYTVRCTDKYKKQAKKWNGYDVCIANDALVQTFIVKELDGRALTETPL